MKLRRKKDQEDRLPHGTNRKVTRPEPYQYHAARSSTERRDSRGSFRENKSDKSFLLRIERIVTFGIMSVIVFSLLYVFWLDSEPRVKLVDHHSQTAKLIHETSAYEAGAQAILSNSLFSRTKLTIDTKKFAQELKQRFPELATVTVTIPLTGHRPVVAIQVKEPKLIIESNGVSYIVDQDGVAIAKLSETSSEAQSALVSLPRVDDQSGLVVDNGQQIVTSETVEFILQALHQYEQANIQIDSIVLPAQKPNEVRFTEVNTPYYVKYIVTRSAREQVGAFLAVHNKLTAEGKMAAEYIDVRVEDKVFYR